MASEIRVTTAQLRSKKEELANMNQKFIDVVKNLEATVHTLDGSWEGEAHDSFYAAFNKDKTQMSNFYNAIKAYVQALESIIAKYEATEQTNTGIAKTRNY
jgi:WXG100 family type VII secretion target